MKKIIITLTSLFIVSTLLLSACGTAVETPSSALRVLAVETFLADIAQNVAGERTTVEMLIPLGVDPHAFEPTPQDVAKIADSQVLILNGAGFEEWAAETLENAGGERIVIEASAGLTSRQGREGEEAVMSPAEKTEALCAALADKTPAKDILAGSDAASAAELHGEGEHQHEGQSAEHEHEAELLSLKLNDGQGGYYGYVRFDATEDGEYVIAANGGKLAVMEAAGSADGTPLEIEETLPLACAGLNGGILLDLEAGEYVISLRGLSEESTPFFVGVAGGHHHHHEGDPHFWLDPLNVIKYVENIRDGLVVADPAGRELYTRNAANYILELQALHTWIEAQVAQIPAERRLLVTNHESFGYFADRYGFEIIGTIIPSVSTGASPSAQQLARLVEHVRASGAAAIFLETGSNPQLAEQIAHETGIKVVTKLYTHSITEPSGVAPTYIAMMRYNVNAIVEALK